MQVASYHLEKCWVQPSQVSQPCLIQWLFIRHLHIVVILLLDLPRIFSMVVLSVQTPGKNLIPVQFSSWLRVRDGYFLC